MEGGLTTYMKLENNEYHKVMLTFVSNVVQILCNLLGGGKGGGSLTDHSGKGEIKTDQKRIT